MCGRAYDPRFMFTWPNSRTAVMGGEQAANVLATVMRDNLEAAGKTWSAEEEQKFKVCLLFFSSAQSTRSNPFLTSMRKKVMHTMPQLASGTMVSSILPILVKFLVWHLQLHPRMNLNPQNSESLECRKSHHGR